MHNFAGMVHIMRSSYFYECCLLCSSFIVSTPHCWSAVTLPIRWGWSFGCVLWIHSEVICLLTSRPPIHTSPMKLQAQMNNEISQTRTQQFRAPESFRRALWPVWLAAAQWRWVAFLQKLNLAQLLHCKLSQHKRIEKPCIVATAETQDRAFY